MSDEQLIAAFNRQVGNGGWTSYRATYLAALYAEFETRQYDYSEIGGKTNPSLRWKVKLINRKLVIDSEASAQTRWK